MSLGSIGRQLFWPVLLTMLASCGASPDMVQSFAIQRFSCPPDWVNVRQRDDLRPSTLVLREPENPPPGIVGDPSRLLLWRERRRSEAQSWHSNDVFEVQACGQPLVLFCNYGRHNHPD